MALGRHAHEVRAVLEWCERREIGGLDARRVFAHCVELRRQGRTPATIRRRLAAIGASEVGVGHPGISVGLSPQMRGRLLNADASRASVLVLSDDSITRLGLWASVSETSALCWADPVAEMDAATMTVWDYALVWVSVPRGMDRYGAIPSFDALDDAVATALPIIGIYTGDLPLLVRLRLSEAGFRYAIPHSWISTNLHRLSELLTVADLPTRFHLETPLALRQRLGLSLSGRIATLLTPAAAFSREVWTSPVPQSQLPISRREIAHLRAIAVEKAGIPAPDFRRYATSTRRAPEAPEWGVVREVVRVSLGLESGRP